MERLRNSSVWVWGDKTSISHSRVLTSEEFLITSGISSNIASKLRPLLASLKDNTRSFTQEIYMCINGIKKAFTLLFLTCKAVSVCMGLEVWLVTNFAQQHLTTCNRLGKRMQHVTSNIVGSFWQKMLPPFAHSLKLHLFS